MSNDNESLEKSLENKGNENFDAAENTDVQFGFLTVLVPGSFMKVPVKKYFQGTGERAAIYAGIIGVEAVKTMVYCDAAANLIGNWLK